MTILEARSSPLARWLHAFAFLWVVAVSCGVAMVWRYTLTPGSAAVAPDHWPAELGISRPASKATLVMTVHPKCPCSRASISELAVLAANCGSGLSIDILFVEPQGLVIDVKSTELWQSAEHIPGATLLGDPHGALARQFGAATSGQVFLYDIDGTLRFSGGITDSRGHAGNNAGRSAIEAIVRAEMPGAIRTPVFGCAL